MQNLTIDQLLENPIFILTILLGVSVLLLMLEGYKYLKYKTRSDILDLSLMITIFLATYILFEDLFLSGLAVIFVLMLIGMYEFRESPVWYRLMAAFTLTYGYLLVTFLIAETLELLSLKPSWLEEYSQISGFGLSTTLWVLLFWSFLFFGRRFILVSRFLSPQYVYLFLYALVYIGILSLQIDFAYRYIALFIANFFIYLNSGWILTKLFGIKALNDERSLQLMKQVQEKIGTNVRFIGIVEAPILNAFAYGPWFDQRFAFIVKDINDFTNEELLGIAAHEMAHLKKKHTLWLLFLGFIDLTFRAIAGIPASIYDFPVGNTGETVIFGLTITWTIFNYYVVNFLLFTLALVFVRIMEGQADLVTKKSWLWR